MNQFRKTRLLIKELGISNLAAYARYQIMIKSGALKVRFPPNDSRFSRVVSRFDLKKIKGLSLDWDSLQKSEIDPLFIDKPLDLLNGSVKLFGIVPAELNLKKSDVHLDYWTNYSETFGGTDIKLTWEPARFTWVYPLIHAWKVTQNEEYPEAFWRHVEEFNNNNLVNMGPHWSSAQEMALRTIAWIFALEGFKTSAASEPRRVQALLEIILLQLDRIPVTIHYARAQHNNHLLSEALALLLAGDTMKNLIPQAANWSELGKREFIAGILDQIEPDGTYSQHSTNYHRLMLQLALLFHHHMKSEGNLIPSAVLQRLASATRWALAQLDPLSGRLPNLGHNDGALLLPIGNEDYRDHRPTLQAAALAFLGQPALPSGKWDQLSTLLGLRTDGDVPQIAFDSPAIHKVGSGEMWGALRAVRFKGRPAHADQLHVDLWWRGENLARDPGTYLYNGVEPWTNSLDRTSVHNTIFVDKRNQMERISRFLWLDQAQATIIKKSKNECTAIHDGYKKQGVLHQRTLKAVETFGFIIQDELKLLPGERRNHQFTLHWLLPDWNHRFDGNTLTITNKHQKVSVTIGASKLGNHEILNPAMLSLIRGGETLLGNFESPIHGWESNTYAHKNPALSLLIEFEANESLEITTKWECSDV